LKRLEQELSCERLRPSVVAALQRALALPVSNTLEQVRAAQQELRRLGCFEGIADGDPGIVTRSALNRYLAQRGRTTSDIEITDAFVSELKSQTARVCPLVCPPGRIVEGEQCVVPPKPAPVARPRDEDQDKRQKAKLEVPAPHPKAREEEPAPRKAKRDEQRAHQRGQDEDRPARSRPQPRVRQEAARPYSGGGGGGGGYGGGGGGGGGHGVTMGVGF